VFLTASARVMLTHVLENTIRVHPRPSRLLGLGWLRMASLSQRQVRAMPLESLPLLLHALCRHIVEQPMKLLPATLPLLQLPLETDPVVKRPVHNVMLLVASAAFLGG